MRRLLAAIALVLAAAVAAAACGVNLKTIKKGWVLPDDSAAVESQSQPARFPSLSEGTTAVVVSYAKPGLRTRAPDGKGWWEFREATRFLFKGKPFAIAGRVYQLSSDKKGNPAGYLGCVIDVAIYDDDGDGKYETIVESAGTGGPRYRLPAWATAHKQQ